MKGIGEVNYIESSANVSELLVGAVVNRKLNRPVLKYLDIYYILFRLYEIRIKEHRRGLELETGWLIDAISVVMMVAALMNVVQGPLSGDLPSTVSTYGIHFWRDNVGLPMAFAPEVLSAP